MGLRDTEEMLEACQADAAQLERDLTRTRAERDVQIVETKRLQRAVNEIRGIVNAADADGWDESPGTVQAVRAIVGEAPDLEHP